MKIYLIIAVIVLVGIFFLQNTGIVEIRFLLWHLTVSRVLLLLGSLAAGFVLGVLATLEIRRKKTSQKQENIVHE